MENSLELRTHSSVDAEAVTSPDVQRGMF